MLSGRKHSSQDTLHCRPLSERASSTAKFVQLPKVGFTTRYMTPAGKALKALYEGEARYQWGFAKPLTGDIAVSIALYFGNRRKADLDNFNKLSLDALTGIVWEDDSQIAKLTIERVMIRRD
ncbi:RusA family crossover junction endodeoxyribonuclease [Bradyrhizobium barranii]|uniref:RusA family crossover junction endodeoxyribonuclease n=1 Tax=Bradyrhizobium barranii TaxID=2992140 RepID=UPI004033C535